MDFSGNYYPNPDNYAAASFPDGIMPPSVDPDVEPQILVQYSPEWTPVLMAAVNQLLQYSTWQGTHDDKITAVNRAELLRWQLQHPVNVGDEEWPTPFWDEDTTVDDEQPETEQEWYGMVTNPSAPAGDLSFVQNAVIWLLTGFVAIAASPTLLGGAAAAIFFRTTAVRFTLAWNRGDVREIFRVVIDANDYATVDTDGMAIGDVIELNVDGLEDLSTHEITIIRTT